MSKRQRTHGISRRSQRLAVEKLYAQIPDVKCKGLCIDACSIIGFQDIEYEAMKKASGTDVGFDGEHCSLLVNGRCTAYEARPTVCRLFGVAEHLRCPYGCQPEGGLLKSSTASRIMSEVERVCGHNQWFNANEEQIEAFVNKELWHNASFAKRILLRCTRILNTLKNLLNRLRSIFTRTNKAHFL